MNESMEFSFDKILTDGISDMVFIMSVQEENEFIYDFMNRGATEKSGITRSALGKTIREVCSMEKASLLYDKYNNVVTSKNSVTFEDSFMSDLGEEQYPETTLTPLFNDNKQCKQIVAVVKEITQKKRVEAEVKKTLDNLKDYKNQFQSLFQNNSDAIVTIDLNGRITDGNVAVENVTGFSSKELIGITLSSLVVKKDINLVIQLFKDVIGGTTDNRQLEIQNKAGEYVIVSLKATPLIIEEKIIGIYCVIKDITDTVNSYKKLEDSEERFRIIAENAHDLITLVNDRGIITYASPSYKQILGIDYKEYVGKFFLHDVDPDYRERMNKIVLHSIKKGEPFSIQIKQFNHNGESIWCESNGTPVFDKQNNFKHLVVLTRDISLQKDYELKLKHFANHDSLTGLPNRRYFKECLTLALESYYKNNDGLAVILLDIDHFKNINDEKGHDIGDGVIEEFGKRVSQIIPDDDMVARLGGDEFVILLPSIGSIDNVASIAKGIQKVIRQPWNINGISVDVTASMGIAIASTHGATSYAMLKNADLALYEAKDAGRNTFIIRKIENQ